MIYEIDQLDFIEIINFILWKTQLREWKNKQRLGEDTHKTLFYKGLIPKINKQFLKFYNKKKQTT